MVERRLQSGVKAALRCGGAAIALYLTLTGVLLGLSLGRTGGAFVYAQDDPYIHLAIARTLAEHGVWGISPHQFASASSSPLWTVLLASLWFAGARAVWVPFALNVVCGVGLLAAVTWALSRESSAGQSGSGMSTAIAGGALFALVLVTPLPTLAFIGMEHTLQVLLVLTFAWQVSARLDAADARWIVPALTAAVMTATRYESLFLVAIVVAILIWRGRVGAAALLGVIAVAPVVVFGWYSVQHGGLVLPNSVLMKSGPGRFGTVGSGISALARDWIAILNLFVRPSQMALTVSTLALMVLVPSARLLRAGRPFWLAVLFVTTSALHACLVKLEWFFRYEAYLMALGVIAIAGLIPIAEWPKEAGRRKERLHPALLPLAVLLTLPLAARALTALATTVPATVNVRDQQVQLGRFFRQAYPDRPIAVNDLGAVAWMSTSRILDIVGLASQPVADLKRQKALDARALAALADADGVEAIAVYEEIFRPILPPSWVKVGEWEIARNVALSGDTVTFFARTPEDATRLRAALDAFAGTLPRGVVWRRSSF